MTRFAMNWRIPTGTWERVWTVRISLQSGEGSYVEDRVPGLGRVFVATYCPGSETVRVPDVANGEGGGI